MFNWTKWMQFVIFLSRISTYVEFRISIIFIVRENLLKTSPTTVQWIVYCPMKTHLKKKISIQTEDTVIQKREDIFWDTWKSYFSHRTNYQCSFNCTILIHLWGIKTLMTFFRKKSWQEKWNELKHCTHFQTRDMSFWICIKKILKPKKSICEQSDFYPTVCPYFNIEGNHLKFKPTTIHKLRDLLQQTDLKHLNLNGRCKCSENKGHFFGSLSIYNYILMVI